MASMPPQVATLFGVSRRTVHLWLVGERMPRARLERLYELLRRIREQKFESPDAANRWLFTIVEDRPRFSDWAAERGSRRPVFTVMEELDRDDRLNELANG